MSGFLFLYPYDAIPIPLRRDSYALTSAGVRKSHARRRVTRDDSPLNLLSIRSRVGRGTKTVPDRLNPRNPPGSSSASLWIPRTGLRTEALISAGMAAQPASGAQHFRPYRVAEDRGAARP
jgi:hypothetical protein